MAIVFTVTGTELDPSQVSEQLGSFPDKFWRAGEQREAAGRKFDGVYEKSGWKKFAPPELREDLATDFDYWLAFIERRKSALARLHAEGHCVSIDLLIQSDVYQLEPHDLQLLADAGGTCQRI